MAPVCAVWLIVGCIMKASSLPEVQAPPAIYRGPMSLAGVGSALIPMFLGMQVFSPGFLWATWKSAGYVHGSTDPINSWVLWTTGYLKVSGNTHIKTALPFTWLAAALGTIAAILMIG